MPGFVSNPYSYMSRCDVFVLPSRWEGFPNLLVEAMTCGAKVIATDCPGGSAEILEGGKYGRLVDIENVKSLAYAIENPVSCNSLIKVSEFSIDKILDKYLVLFNRLNF